MSSLPRDNLAYPVRIAFSDSIGSGFYYNTEDGSYLVTARHVLFKNGLELYRGSASLTSMGSDLTSKVELDVDFEALLKVGFLEKHNKADVAVAKIGIISEKEHVLSLANGIKLSSDNLPPGVGFVGLPRSSTTKFSDTGISNEIILFGYPASLGREAQIDRSRPLLRRGIIAGKSEDNRIVLDCPVYFGNSGGLVIEVTEPTIGSFRFNGIGIAVEMVPFVEELWSKQFKTQTGVRYENSGYSLVEPIDRVEEVIREIVRKVG